MHWTKVAEDVEMRKRTTNIGKYDKRETWLCAGVGYNFKSGKIYNKIIRLVSADKKENQMEITKV